MDNGLLRTDESTPISTTDITNVNSLLALLHGKNNSICRLFTKEIKVDKIVLKRLNEMMLEKLILHEIKAVTTTVDITLRNKKTISCISWDEFENYDFQIESASTKSIFLQWDFFLLLSGYEYPQRHTISIRISSTPQPGDVLRAMLDGGFDRIDELDFQASTVICKVDFINNTLAEELINVVSKWNELCVDANSERGELKKHLYLHRDLLAHISDCVLIITISFLLAIIIKIIVNKFQIKIDSNSLLYMMIFIIPMYGIVKKLGNQFGQRVFSKLSQIMTVHIFDISNGDYKMIEKLKKQSDIKKDITIFFFNILASIVLSIIFFIID